MKQDKTCDIVASGNASLSKPPYSTPRFSVRWAARIPMALFMAQALIAANAFSADPAITPGSTVLPPGIVLQNLPASQQRYRTQQVRAVSAEIASGSRISLMTYADTVTPPWQRIVIPRAGKTLGETSTVILVRVDDQDKTVDVAVRGTDNLDDAIKDLDIAAVQDKRLGIPLHAGFQSIALGVIGKLESMLGKQQLDTYTFRLYGHSLGGAVASIVSMYMHQDGRDVGLVVTFGAPRFTTNEGARKYQVLNSKTYRVVRCDDVVPFLPPPSFFGWTNQNYQANGNLLLLLKPPYFDYSVGIDIERDFTHQLRTELNNVNDRQALVFGHRMKNYDELVYELSPMGIRLVENQPDLVPVSYTLKQQSTLCPARLSPAMSTSE